ncbi:MAG: DUF998 domain-containing protein [Candidatus Thermoplasmatota archaeon]|nr:DUF998 domain-containing protein [Candidatus Thermoplasmatota archaeon]
MENRVSDKFAGLALFIGVAQFLMMVMIAEFLYPGYSVSQNYISDLGVGSTAYIFNSSIIVLGVLALVSAYFLRSFSVAAAIITVILAIGAIGVGFVNENHPPFHLIFALLAFGGSSILPYAVLHKTRKPIAVVWAILGTIGLIALILFASHDYLGLGEGGMERMIMYPDLIWAMSFGGWLTRETGNKD